MFNVRAYTLRTSNEISNNNGNNSAITATTAPPATTTRKELYNKNVYKVICMVS